MGRPFPLLFLAVACACGASRTSSPGARHVGPLQRIAIRHASPASLPTALRRPRSRSGKDKADDNWPFTGVPACDEFLVKYTSCIWPHVGEAERREVEGVLDEMRVSWRSAAATKAGRSAVDAACRSALDAAKRALTQYNCRW